MELVKVDTRKPLEKRRPTAEDLGESTAKSESLMRPLILASATISAALPGGSRSCSLYWDRESALGVASACVSVPESSENMQAGSSRRLELRRMHA